VLGENEELAERFLALKTARIDSKVSMASFYAAQRTNNPEARREHDRLVQQKKQRLEEAREMKIKQNLNQKLKIHKKRHSSQVDTKQYEIQAHKENLSK
jgi:hypothetical protein